MATTSWDDINKKFESKSLSTQGKAVAPTITATKSSSDWDSINATFAARAKQGQVNAPPPEPPKPTLLQRIATAVKPVLTQNTSTRGQAYVAPVAPIVKKGAQVSSPVIVGRQGYVAPPRPAVDPALEKNLLQRGVTPQQVQMLAPEKTQGTFSLPNMVEASDKFMQGAGAALSFPAKVVTDIAPKTIQAGTQAGAQKVNEWLKVFPESKANNKSFSELYKKAPGLTEFIREGLPKYSNVDSQSVEANAWANFLPEFLAQVASAGVAATVLSAVGSKVATKTKTTRITPQQIGDVMTGRVPQGVPLPKNVQETLIKELSKPENSRVLIKQALKEGVDITQINPASPIRQILGNFIGGNAGESKTAFKIGGKDIPSFSAKVLNPKLVGDVINDSIKQVGGADMSIPGQERAGLYRPDLVEKIKAINPNTITSWDDLTAKMNAAVNNEKAAVDTVGNFIKNRQSTFAAEPALAEEMLGGPEFVSKAETAQKNLPSFPNILQLGNKPVPPPTSGKGFTFSDKVDKAKLEQGKLLADYREAVQKFTQKPTAKNKEAVVALKAKVDATKPTPTVEVSKTGVQAPGMVTEAQRPPVSASAPAQAALEAPVSTPAPEMFTPEPKAPITPAPQGISMLKPAEPLPSGSGNAISKAARDISDDLVSKGFEALAPEEQARFESTPGAKKITLQRVSNQIAKSMDDSIKMALGELPAPNDVSLPVLFESIVAHADATGNVQLMRDLAKSPVASMGSIRGKELGEISFNKNRNSAVEVFKDINKTLGEKTAKKRSEVKKSIDNELKKSSEARIRRKLLIEDYLNSIAC